MKDVWEVIGDIIGGAMLLGVVALAVVCVIGGIIWKLTHG